MRRSTRTLTALLVAAPLLGSAVLPANAAPKQEQYTSSGTSIHLSVDGASSSGVVPGNYLMGDVDIYNNEATGYLISFDCEDGAIPGDEAGCDYAGEFSLYGNVTTSKGKGKTKSTSVSGTLTAYSWNYDGEDEEYIELGQMQLDATVSPYGKAIKTRDASTYVDPNTGERWSYRSMRTSTSANVTGSLDSIDLASWGSIGTYKNMERYPAMPSDG
ncbi:hypothetical protein [Ornithinimicrobium sp. Y1694]|uniref:hypothetical protein n=1 Tax=Ornithinimicrobium sp. Y1694 TaxID=3418590 RepID=UPI003CEEB77E